MGLGLGLLIAVILELSERFIRTDDDASAVMDLPLLISVPWLGDEEGVGANGHERRRFWTRGSPEEEEKEEAKVEV
jgi:hypothetical protein